MNPQRYWLVVEAAAARSYSIWFSLDNNALPLASFQARACNFPADSEFLALEANQTQHIRLLAPLAQSANSSVRLQLAVLFGDATISWSTSTLATPSCSSGRANCVNKLICIVDLYCQQAVSYFIAVRGIGGPLRARFTSCVAPLPTISVSSARPRDQISIERRSSKSIAKFVVDPRNLASPRLVIAIDDKRGGFKANLTLFSCGGPSQTDCESSVGDGGCLLVLSPCFFQSRWETDSFDVWISVSSSYDDGEFLVLASLQSEVADMRQLVPGVAQTISLAAGASQLFALNGLSAVPSIIPRAARLELFVSGDGADLNVALAPAPNVPTLPEDPQNCQLLPRFHQEHCSAGPSTTASHPCLTVDSCDTGVTYNILVRHSKWQFRGVNPILPVTFQIRANLTDDIALSELLVNAPRSSRVISPYKMTEMYFNFEGLKQTASLVVSHASDRYFCAPSVLLPLC